MIDQALQGEGVVISKVGKPIAKLIPYQAGAKSRQPGYWRGKVSIAKDFDELPKSLENLFKGETEGQ